jgi:hypothetical protein
MNRYEYLFANNSMRFSGVNISPLKIMKKFIKKFKR